MNWAEMTFAQRVVLIVQAIFGKEIATDDMIGYMMAFADGVQFAEGASEADMIEAVCQVKIGEWRADLVDRIAEFNRSEVVRLSAEYEAQIRQEAASKLEALIN